LNRTGMELLYLPLPGELRNRIKAFVDIFFDRMSRGLGSVILIFMTSLLNMDNLGPSIRVIALVVIGLTLPWMLLSLRARKEYVATIRKRLESRRLDLAGERITVNDPGTVRVLEQAAAGGNSRQAAYALSLLGEAPGYDPRPLLRQLAASEFPEVRAKVYDLSRSTGFSELLDGAIQEVRGAPRSDDAPVKEAVAYALSVAPKGAALATELLEHADVRVSEGVLEALAGQPEAARDLITHGWIAQNAADPDPLRRALAAHAIAVCGDQGTEALYRLLEDPDPEVVAAACRAAGTLRSRAYLNTLVKHLGNSRLRGTVIEALAGYGPQIVGTLGDMLGDENFPVRIRRQIPRVLKAIPHQRSVDVLLSIIGHPDIDLRAAVLKALNRLRETAPRLNFENMFLTQQILNEAHYYFELNAALAPLRERRNSGHTPTGLLVRTIEERLRQTLDRLFRLLGLRYPPKEIYSSYLAVSRRRAEDIPAALDFLDHVLERDLKRILLPLLDAPDRVLEKGRDLFGVDVPDAESAIRDLIRSHDPWLAVCAIAAAAELRLRRLAPDIARAAQTAEAEISEVARSAHAALA
jgi:HEAT repeat protein